MGYFGFDWRGRKVRPLHIPAQRNKEKMKSCIAVLLFLLGSLAFGQNTTGTWTLYPPQATINQVSIDQPINADGSSVWSSKATIPVQYDVLAGPGPVVFASYLSPGTPAYSYLDFAPSSSLTFGQITNLSAVYTFTTGTCHTGALRWSVSLSTGKNIFIYYGKYPNFADCSSKPPTRRSTKAG